MNQISESEKLIMKIIWDNGNEILFGELTEKPEVLDNGWKRTTILTFLSRLTEKKFLSVTKEGRINRYTALVSEEDYLSEQTKSFVQKVYGGNVQGLLSSLLKRDMLTEEDIDEIKDFWNGGKGSNE